MPSGMTRRETLAWLVSGAAMTVLAACAPTAPDPTRSAPTGQPTSAVPGPQATGQSSAAPTGGQPKPGGTLRLGMTSDLSSLEAHLLSRDQYDSVWNVWDRF